MTSSTTRPQAAIWMFAPPVNPLARRQAIKQIERKRRFWMGTAYGHTRDVVLTAIWASSEYHSAGGWVELPADLGLKACMTRTFGPAGP